MSSNEQYPARVEQFHAVAVTIYEIDGKDYLAGEDIGSCLGMTEPRKSVNKIYNRNREEFEAHTFVVKMGTNYPGNPINRLFTETGANLIGMFSRTPKAKDFRLWLARLPRRARQAQDCLPAALDQARRQGLREGAAKALSLMGNKAAAKLGLEGVAQLVWLRRRGLTQMEAGELLGFSKDAVGEVERVLKDLGLSFPAIIGNKRHREMRLGLADALSEPEQIPPGPLKAGETPALRLKGGEEAGHGASAS